MEITLLGTGCPSVHTERYGPLCILTAHAPFSIDADASSQWVACMVAALEDTSVRDDLRAALVQAFTRTTEMLRNDDRNTADPRRV